MKEQEIVEYNKRQIRLMEETIQQFKDNKITIKHFISNMEALPSLIQNQPKEWVKNINDLVWEIEIIYACALDKERSVFSPEEQAMVFKYVEKIEGLIAWYKNNYFSPEE